MRFNLSLTSLNLHSFVFSIKNEKRKGRMGRSAFYVSWPSCARWTICNRMLDVTRMRNRIWKQVRGTEEWITKLLTGKRFELSFVPIFHLLVPCTNSPLHPYRSSIGAQGYPWFRLLLHYIRRGLFSRSCWIRLSLLRWSHGITYIGGSLSKLFGQREGKEDTLEQPFFSLWYASYNVTGPAMFSHDRRSYKQVCCCN